MTVEEVQSYRFKAFLKVDANLLFPFFYFFQNVTTYCVVRVPTGETNVPYVQYGTYSASGIVISVLPSREIKIIYGIVRT